MARDSPARRERRRRAHRSTESTGELLPRPRATYDRDSPSPSPTKTRPKRSQHRSSRAPESEASKSTSNALSSGQLAQLDKLNQKLGWSAYDDVQPQQDRESDIRAEEEEEEARRRERRRRREERRRRREEEGEDDLHYRRKDDPDHHHRRKRERERRVVSGPTLEQGREEYYSEKEEHRHDVRRRDGSSSDPSDYDEDARRRKRRRIFIIVGVIILILVIAIPVGIVVSKKNDSSGNGNGGAPSSSGSASPSNSNLNGISESSIPASAHGTYLDPFTWYDTTDFNVTYTNATVGGLPIMGLNTSYNDNTRANNNVPPLNEEWQYGTMVVRGVNLGGWLSIEPFITPSLFSGYSTHDNVVDEYTLSQTLGPSKAKSTIEQHYSSFVTEQTFADIQAAGFDHVRIPFSYWAVTTYEGDPYLPQVSWRYLLRGIEWARKYGLRINLDLHGAPGSQNGWNHSGRQGLIGWLNGTDGQLNADRTLDIHNQLSQFFTQPRYKSIITMYGLVNEPRMVVLDTDAVLNWSTTAIDTIQQNNFTGIIIFGDGFMGLPNWQGKLQGIKNLLLDVHQYVIFNVEQIVLDHSDKVNFACAGWTAQTVQSENTATGFGPTLCGEWSQADTDCALYLNDVGVGSRWEGTLNLDGSGAVGGSTNGSVLTPTCPTDNNPQCSCTDANADPSTYSAAYKEWLLMFAEAQMYSFEQGWGWFYWTWQTESATQWSYTAGMAAGILPQLAYQRNFTCKDSIPNYASLGLSETY